MTYSFSEITAETGHTLSFGRFSLKNKHKMQMLSFGARPFFRIRDCAVRKSGNVCVRMCMPVTGYRVCVCEHAECLSWCVHLPACRSQGLEQTVVPS